MNRYSSPSYETRPQRLSEGTRERRARRFERASIAAAERRRTADDAPVRALYISGLASARERYLQR